VGLVYLHATGPGREEARRTDLPGDREMVRGRASAAALHLLRRMLTQSRDEAV
jgi:nicotinamide mononucleotide (NMN) deamidase PncC